VAAERFGGLNDREYAMKLSARIARSDDRHISWIAALWAALALLAAGAVVSGTTGAPPAAHATAAAIIAAAPAHPDLGTPPSAEGALNRTEFRGGLLA
jgi:hypothetical protein